VLFLLNLIYFFTYSIDIYFLSFTQTRNSNDVIDFLTANTIKNYTHISLLHPLDGRLLWRKEGIRTLKALGIGGIIEALSDTLGRYKHLKTVDLSTVLDHNFTIIVDDMMNVEAGEEINDKKDVEVGNNHGEEISVLNSKHAEPLHEENVPSVCVINTSGDHSKQLDKAPGRQHIALSDITDRLTSHEALLPCKVTQAPLGERHDSEQPDAPTRHSLTCYCCKKCVEVDTMHSMVKEGCNLPNASLCHDCYVGVMGLLEECIANGRDVDEGVRLDDDFRDTDAKTMCFKIESRICSLKDPNDPNSLAFDANKAFENVKSHWKNWSQNLASPTRNMIMVMACCHEYLEQFGRTSSRSVDFVSDDGGFENGECITAINNVCSFFKVPLYTLYT
jgi:hypothetical protein